VPQADGWNSITFQDNGKGTLEYCKILYTGYWQDAAIVCRNNTSPTVKNCEISDVSGDAIQLYDTASPSITNCTVTNADWAIKTFSLLALPSQIEGNTSSVKYFGLRSEDNRIEEGQEITLPVYADNLPYSIHGIYIEPNASLTVLPGTILKINNLQPVEVKGTLNAQGTPESPIVFTEEKDDLGGDRDIVKCCV